ncbi:MAG: hypothetical protein LBM94_02585 [Propionibacteriaceae bacterium]|jgi:hypothetical protein|nr:hypothetical protein [Propionibacteriaceae bacterium]
MSDETLFPVAPGGQPAVYVLHENPSWLPPFVEAFAAEGVPLIEWQVTGGVLDLDQVPPPGVFWSRFSASSHTRGHEISKDLTRSVLSWLELWGAPTVNGRSVLELEVSKVAQLVALHRAGIAVPRTVAVFGPDDLWQTAQGFDAPFILKHNQGGKGLGVRRFDSHGALRAYLDSPDYDAPVDGIELLQEYVPPSDGFITRAEFIGGKFLYAVKVDTTRGGFQLCPADACEIDPFLVPGATSLEFCPADSVPGPVFAPVPAPLTVPAPVVSAPLAPIQVVPASLEFCPADLAPAPSTGASLFSWREGFDHPIIGAYEAFLAEHHIAIAGIEFIETADGRLVTYDVNTNTNYNSAVEAVVPLPAARAVARYLGGLLQKA